MLTRAIASLFMFTVKRQTRTFRWICKVTQQHVEMYCAYYLTGSVFEHCLDALHSLPSAAIAKNALFRQRCNNFFIDVVTTMCFKDNEPPDTAVIQELLSLLFVYRGLLGDSGELSS